MEKLVIAGACSVFGLSDIRASFAELGFDVSFVDAPFMAGIRIHEYPETEEITYTAELSENAIAVPLSEYWISYCKKHRCCRIAQKALECSRSKAFFYYHLEKSGFDFPEIYKDENSAEKALEKGKKIIVKPIGLHSGYGIEILDKSGKEKLSEYIKQAANIKNRTLRLMEIENTGVMLTEAVEGPEYSADCFYFRGRVSIVRICRKLITVINDKPCCAAYRLLSPEEIEYKRFESYLKNWTESVFEKSDISYAQYDFIDSSDGRVVPIDFASRVGGGISDLLIESGKNPYALSVSGILFSLPKNLCQFSYLPVVSGYVKNDDYPLRDGKKRVFKKRGDYVISNPSSVGSRMALTVSTEENEFTEETVSQLLLGKEFISPDKIKIK